MDFVRKNAETTIHLIVQPTFEAFTAELEKSRESIESVRKKTFKYGNTDRHQLDVYYPPSPSERKPPILFFVYGGGYFSGERSFAPPMDLCYTNLGSFFAKRGFLTVIPDYRLTPVAKYPNPSEDVRDALAYVVENLSDVGDVDNLFVMAHSAGSAIAITVFLHPTLITEGKGANVDLRKHVKAINLMAGAYTYEGPPGAAYPGFIEQFFEANSEEKVPLGLLKTASPSIVSSLPPILISRSERDAEPILYSQQVFVDLLQQKLGRELEIAIAKEHNHISPHWALETGDGEEWGEEVANWFKKHTS